MRRAAWALAVVALGCTNETAPPGPLITDEERALLETLRYDDAAVATDPSNAFADDLAARALGQKLFFDPGFSGRLLEGDNDGTPSTLGLRGETGKVSCASCHVPEDGFVDTRSPHREISLAAQWTIRRTPTLLETGFTTLYNWDGRRDTLWNQALGVVESDREFNSSRYFFAQEVLGRYGAEYEAIFGAPPDLSTLPPLAADATGCELELGLPVRCRGKPGDAAEYDALSAMEQDAVTRVAVNATKAMASYIATLRCGPGAFDRWLDGDDTALSIEAQRGAALFVGRAGCIDCHTGPRLTDDEFHNVGLTPQIVAVAFVDRDDRGAALGIAGAIDDPLNARGTYSDGDRGHLPTSVDAAHEGAFRTPTLRCVSQQPSFMHTAHFHRLDQVVSFFARGGDRPGGYPGTSELTPLDLDERDRADLVAFLEALSGPGPDPALLTDPR
jgi:cytochrome c peroxidase